MEKQNGSADKQNGSAKLATQKEIIRKIYDAFEKGNSSEFENYFANDVNVHIADPAVKSTGIQAVKDQVEIYRKAFPDLKFEIKEIFGDGEKLTIYSSVTGTHTGDLLGMSPTNKKITVDTIEFVKFKGDKITDQWGVYDSLGMFSQLGLVSFEDLVKQKQEVH